MPVRTRGRSGSTSLMFRGFRTGWLLMSVLVLTNMGTLGAAEKIFILDNASHDAADRR